MLTQTEQLIQRPAFLKPITTLNYGRMLKFHHYIQDQLKKDTLCSYFNSDDINRFYAKHEVRINTILNDIVNLKNKYFAKDENGAFLSEEKEGKLIHVLKDGLKLENFNVEMSELMQRKILI